MEQRMLLVCLFEPKQQKKGGQVDMSETSSLA
jgi:hypothetical protein